MSVLNNTEKLDDVYDKIVNLLETHHEIYDLPVKAELWENILSKALDQSGLSNDWRPDFNHAQGVDMSLLPSGERISCKSGAIEEENLKFSGSRMTKHISLDDKLDFLSDKKDDVYMLLSRDKREWINGDHKYYFIAFPSDMLDYNSLVWENTIGQRGKYQNEINGHVGLSDAVSAKIEFSMSHQIWTTIKNFRKNPAVFVREIFV